MLNLNEDNVPELLTYTKEEIAYNKAMELLTPESEGYDKPYYVSEKYYLEDELSIIDGKVVSSAPWFEAGGESVVEHFYELPAVYAYMDFDTKITLCNDFDDGTDTITKLNNSREYEHGGHGYKLTIKDNIITEMVEVYGE